MKIKLIIQSNFMVLDVLVFRLMVATITAIDVIVVKKLLIKKNSLNLIKFNKTFSAIIKQFSSIFLSIPISIILSAYYVAFA